MTLKSSILRELKKYDTSICIISKFMNFVNIIKNYQSFYVLKRTTSGAVQVWKDFNI